MGKIRLVTHVPISVLPKDLVLLHQKGTGHEQRISYRATNTVTFERGL